MIINSYCTNLGWLFEDLQGCFRKLGLLTTEAPLEEADCWLCIRTGEAYKAPDISRTIVQVHDMYDYDVTYFQKAALVIFTHPLQFWLWKKRGFSGNHKIIPIGARSDITKPLVQCQRPTLGFFCGETPSMEKQSLLFKEVVTTVRKEIDIDVLMIGRNLDHIADLGTYIEKAADVSDYQQIDALFTSSISPAVPLSVYEACSIGIPVISTPRWFPVR